VRIALFSGLRVEIEGRDVTRALPGRQGRALLAYLAARWPEAVSRDELFEVLWPTSLPADPASDFRALLAKLRRALWPDAIDGRESLALRLPDGAAFDVSETAEHLALAERAFSAGDHGAALRAADSAAETLARPFLAGLQGAWVEERLLRFDDDHRRALEISARAGLAVGGEQLPRAERAARALVARDRFREGGYELLMQAQAARGDVAEALRTFDGLRVLLRDELGTRPSAGVLKLHQRLLLGAGDPADVRTVALPAITSRVTEGVFVGREECLTKLRAAWRQASSGPTSIIFVVGPAGIGKTRLAARFAEEVHAEGGAAVLYGRSDEEALTTFQPFVEALRHLLTRGGESFATETARERELLGRLVPDLGPSGHDAVIEASETQRYRLFEAVAALAARATRRWKVLLVLDDLHWADRPTLLLLRHLLRHPDLGRLLVIATSRPPEREGSPALTDFLSGLRRERRYEQVELAGLDLEATGTLISDRLGAEPTPRLVRRLHEQTGGNAFFLEETVRALIDAEGGATEAALDQIGMPKGIAEVILRHVRGLSPPAVELLNAAAVAGREFTLAVAERLVAAPADDVIAALEEALAAQLILEAPGAPDSFTFAHAVVRDVLYRELTGLRRGRLHLRVAEALEAVYDEAARNPAELAHHYAAAQHLAGSEPARRYAILAGRRAARLFAYEEAADHFQRALDLLEPGQEDERCELLLALGRVQYHDSDRRARETFLLAADSARRRGAAEQLARAALGLGERYWETAYVGSRFGELLEEAATLLGDGDSPLRALVLARLAENLAFPSHHERAPALSAEALEIARRLGDENVLTQALLARHVTRLDIRYLDERLALMDELLRCRGEHLELAAERHQWRLYDLLEAGEVGAARDDHARLEALAGELRQPLFQTLAVGWRGVLAEIVGDIELAERCADDCRRFAERAQARDAQSTWASKVFALRRRAGRLAELDALTEQLARERRPGWLPALGILRAELGDTTAAKGILDDALRGGPEALPEGMFRLVTLALLADLSALLGDAEHAPGLYAALTPYAHRCVVIAYSSCWGPVDHFLAMLAETTGDRARAEQHVHAALARAREMDAPLLAGDIERRHPHLIGATST
jgi:DNA-binding SARP family transcriptional activator